MKDIWITHLAKLKTNNNQLYAIAKPSTNIDIDWFDETYEDGIELIQTPKGSPDWTPYVFRVGDISPSNELLQSLIENGIGQMAVAFILAPEMLLMDLVEQLRRYILAEDKNGDVYWLQFWDAGVAPSFFNSLNADEHTRFFESIDLFIVEDFKDPEVAQVFSRENLPEPKPDDKPNTWRENGVMLLNPDLQTALQQGYDDCRSYLIARQLIQNVPHGEDNVTEVYHWVKTQMAFIQSRPDGERIKVQENFITAAWLSQCEVEDLPTQLDLPTQQEAGSAYHLSMAALSAARSRT